MAIEGKRAARDYAGRFKRSDTPRNIIDKVIRNMAPNDRPSTLVALFDGRASYHTIRDWRRGRYGPPRWAVELLQEKTAAHLAAIAQIKTGPGSRAGYRNIGAWRAAQNSER